MIKIYRFTQALLFTATFKSFSSSAYSLRLAMMSTSSSLILCQRDSYLRESINKVLLCEKYPESNNYKIILDDSVLYPEGGGQPCDLGSINGIPVLRVIKPDISTVKGTFPPTSVEAELPEIITEGSVVKCVIDWERRYDFMQQHTAQHLLSAVADKLFQASTVGWSLGTDSVTVDLASSVPLTTDQLLSLEDEVNRRIRSGAIVSWKVFPKEEVAALGDREGFENLRGSVKGAALEMDELRLVTIDDLDINPCGGTHLRSLAEINLLSIIGLEKDRNAQRIRFVAGQRALNYVRNCIQRESAMSIKLSAPSTEHFSLIDKLLKDKKDTEKKLDLANEELATFFGQSLVSGLDKATDSCPPLVLQYKREGDLKFLIKAGTVAQETASTVSGLVIFLCGDDPSNISPVSKKGTKIPPKSPQPTSGPFILFGDGKLIDSVKDRVLAIIDGKAGGRPGKLQGQATKLSAIEDVKALLSAEMTNFYNAIETNHSK